MGPLMLQDKRHATAPGCPRNRSLGSHVRSTIPQSSGRGSSSPGSPDVSVEPRSTTTAIGRCPVTVSRIGADASATTATTPPVVTRCHLGGHGEKRISSSGAIEFGKPRSHSSSTSEYVVAKVTIQTSADHQTDPPNHPAALTVALSAITTATAWRATTPEDQPVRGGGSGLISVVVGFASSRRELSFSMVNAFNARANVSLAIR